MQYRPIKTMVFHTYIMYRMESHSEQLARHCRVCGRKLSKSKGRSTSYSTIDHQEVLLACFGVDVSHDDTELHPPKFCNCCYATAKQHMRRSSSMIPHRHSIVPMNWTPHTRNSCLVRTLTIVDIQ